MNARQLVSLCCAVFWGAACGAAHAPTHATTTSSVDPAPISSARAVPGFEEVLEQTFNTPERVYLIAVDGSTQRCQPLEWKGLRLYEVDAPVSRETRAAIDLRPGRLDPDHDGIADGAPTVVLLGWIVHLATVDPAQAPDRVASLGECSATYSELSAVAADAYSFGNITWYRSQDACERGRAAGERPALDAACTASLERYTHSGGGALPEAIRRIQSGGSLYEVGRSLGSQPFVCVDWRFDPRTHQFVHVAQETTGRRTMTNTSTYHYELDGRFMVETGPRLERTGDGPPRSMRFSDYALRYLVGVDDDAFYIGGGEWHLTEAGCAAGVARANAAQSALKH